MKTIIQPFSEKRLGDYIQDALKGNLGNFIIFQVAVAFAKRSGVQHIADELKDFITRDGLVRLIIGIDHHGTSAEGLSDLIDIIENDGVVLINHDESPYVTFHPKVYFFEGLDSALVIIGSGNLTQGGLFSNDESCGVYELDANEEKDRAVLAKIKASLDRWGDEKSETVNKLDKDFLDELINNGYVRSESESTVEAETLDDVDQDEVKADEDSEPAEAKKRLFGIFKDRKRPPKGKRRASKRPKEKIKIPSKVPGHPPSEITLNNGFVMTLMQTDVGTGQTTPGTSKRSPEIFIPLAARNADTYFWGWDDEFTEDTNKAGKYDRAGVNMHLGGQVISVNMMTWPDKHDFRLRSEALRSAGTVGDLIKIEKTDGSAGFDYAVEIIPPGTIDYNHYEKYCTNKTRNSDRMWGYY